MIKRIIITVLVLLVVGALSFFVWLKNEEAKLEEFANQAQNISSNNGSEIIKYKMEEVAMHSTKDNCWMVINGRVLDVTTFVDKHPGGTVILQGCGKDATEMFNQIPGHLRGIALTIVNKLKIGELE